ncbi:hypothetical protein D9M70_507400 [compost metagenome]
MQAVFGPTVKNVVRRQRPFVVDEEARLALAKERAEGRPEILDRGGTGKQRMRPGAIEPRIMLGEIGGQKAVACLEISQELLEIGIRHVAARQMGACRPGRSHLGEEGFQPFQCMFGKLAERGDLAAEDREQRRLAIGRIDLENIVAGDGGGVFGVVVIERAHAGEAIDDIVRGQLLLEVAVYRLQQIANLVAVGRYVLRPAFIGDVRRADQRQIVLIGVDEDHPLVRVLDQIGLPPLPELRHDDMAALDQPNAAAGVEPGDPANDVVDPRPGGIDD